MKQNIIYKELGQEAALLDTKTGNFFTLNETGKFIWDVVVSNHFNIEQAGLALSDEYEISEEEAFQAVSSFLDELRDQKLLE